MSQHVFKSLSIIRVQVGQSDVWTAAVLNTARPVYVKIVSLLEVSMILRVYKVSKDSLFVRYKAG